MDNFLLWLADKILSLELAIMQWRFRRQARKDARAKAYRGQW